MRRSVLIAVAAALISGVVAPVLAVDSVAPTRLVDGLISDWVGSSSQFGGTSQYSKGEFVHQDHLFDDLGPNTGARSQQHGTTGAPGGDFRYPSDEARFGHNAADLQEVRFASDGTSLWMLARMSTLKQLDTTVIAFGFDTDRSADTGGGLWPHSAGVSAAGVDVVVTLAPGSASVTSLKDLTTGPVGDVAASTDNAHNSIEARISLSDLGISGDFDVWAAAGLWDGATGSWMAVPTGSPTATAPGGGGPNTRARVWNVAFRDGETGSFLEERQAEVLATGDITPFSETVVLEKLVGGDDEPYEVVPGTFYSRIIDTGFSIGPEHEGLAYDGVRGRFEGVGGAALYQEFSFYGRWQPYGLYVPSTYDGSTRLPAALVLHGHGGSHSSYNAQPGFLRDMGEGGGTGLPPLLLISPLGRGSSSYADYGEADTLAVLDEAIATFGVDTERLYLTGYSMGGYGTYRLASLYPDRFAAAAVWAGYTGEFTGAYATDPAAITGDPGGLSGVVKGVTGPVLEPQGVGGGRRGKSNIGNPVDTLENLRHLPLVHLVGTNDEIVPTTGQYAAPRRLAELGYRSRLDLYPGYEHFSFALVDDWKQARAWLGDQRRTTAPRDIDYVFSDGWTAPGLAQELGLSHGSAWWMRNLTMREPTEDGLTLARASATSRAIASPEVVVAKSTTPAARPTPHVQQLVSWEPTGQSLDIENVLELKLTGVGAVTIDLDRAGLEACSLELALMTDGPVEITLVDGAGVRTVVEIGEASEDVIAIQCPAQG